MKRVFAVIAGLLVAVSVCGFVWLRPGAPALSTLPQQAPPRTDPSPVQTAASMSPASQNKMRGSESTDWGNLQRRLDGMADRIAIIGVQREACQLVQRWLSLDRAAVLAWLEGHRGDQRFDPVIASVAQTLVAAGDFAEAQKLAVSIVDPAVSGWVQQDAWAVAYERGLVTEDQLRKSGLPPEAVGSVAGGSHRD